MFPLDKPYGTVDALVTSLSFSVVVLEAQLQFDEAMIWLRAPGEDLDELLNQVYTDAADAQMVLSQLCADPRLFMSPEAAIA